MVVEDICELRDFQHSSSCRSAFNFCAASWCIFISRHMQMGSYFTKAVTPPEILAEKATPDATTEVVVTEPVVSEQVIETVQEASPETTPETVAEAVVVPPAQSVEKLTVTKRKKRKHRPH